MISAPAALPEFFIKFLTEPGDLVVDPFAGSNTTGMVAETLERRWLAMDAVEEYLEASKFRFNGSLQTPGGTKPLTTKKAAAVRKRVASH